MITAKNRAVAEGRRTAMMDAKHRELEYATTSSTSLDLKLSTSPPKTMCCD